VTEERVPRNRVDKLGQNRAGRAGEETPCEKVARYRAMSQLAGAEWDERLARQIETDMHVEARDRGRQCPCGRSFPDVPGRKGA
jgi:hypothetical protein